MLDDREPERYYDWMLWKLRQEDWWNQMDKIDTYKIDDEKIKNLPHELFIITTEECSELSKECMKYLRWGMDKQRQQNLVNELGDVKCMIDLMVEFGVVSEQELEESAKLKRSKLKRWSKLFDEPK